ncbi:hypothetical protein TUMSATVNIG1_37890 [Vibrio nigripulchritudo]|uniref:hypothetical protein n=1 Tax=Vibrio TaxID=662 RepID=UPI00190919CF|nr:MULTISPECIES: hypothetical protein [Vibrio]UAB73399.1 hypothetical protein INR79_19720 [Vibrio sp. SCSIO 43132]BCL71822.1 hypothetical protein VNTUMSATTG_37590 [Vibrio nigripulchritudo]BDU33180.1 hypothetical protein TUMSATVNIG1_37890 [Vibrio nigripulchritudo]
MDLYVELLQKGDYLVIVVILAISAVFKLPNILDLYKSNRKQRRESITNAIADPGLIPELKDHFKDELNIEYFRNIHGVKLGLPMLKAALILNERVSEQVSFRHVAKAVKTLPNIQGIHRLSYRVRLSKFDTVVCLYNLASGFCLIVSGLILNLVFLYSIFTDFNPGLAAIGVTFLLMGGYMFNDGVAWASVKHINKALEAFEEKSAQPDQ